MQTLDLTKHLIDYQGKPYLPVVWRIAYFRQNYPNYSFVTEAETVNGNLVLAKATIKDDKGNIVSQAHKQKSLTEKDSFSKAETGAIGRALGFFGIGTEFATQDFEEGDEVVDKAVSAQADKAISQSTPAVKALNDAIKGLSNTFKAPPARVDAVLSSPVIFTPPPPPPPKPQSDGYKTQYDGKTKLASAAQIKRLWAISIQKGMSPSEVNRLLADTYGFSDPKNLNWKQYKEFTEFLEKQDSAPKEEEIPFPTDADIPPEMDERIPF